MPLYRTTTEQLHKTLEIIEAAGETYVESLTDPHKQDGLIVVTQKPAQVRSALVMNMGETETRAL